MSNYPFPSMTWREGEVLDYLVNQTDFGWTDNLTEFHEAEAGDNHFIDQASRADAISQLKKYLDKPDAVILEIGCSSGYMLNEIKKNFPCAQVVGADIVREPLEKLAKQFPTIPIIRFDLTDCPLPDCSVDAIVLLNVLEHIEADDKAMQEIKRILKPNGVAIIEVPAGPKLYDIYDKMLMHFRRYTHASLGHLAKKNQMVIKRSSHLGFFLYPGFWLVKKLNRKRYANAGVNDMKKQVSNNIKSTKNNFFLKFLMKIELILGGIISYPVGIRCLMTCQPKRND